MAQLNFTLPVVDGDEDIWGPEINAILSGTAAESNSQDLRLALLETTTTSVQLRLSTVESVVRDYTIAKPTGGVAGYVLTLNTDGTSSWRPVVGGGDVTDDGNDYVLIFQSALQGVDFVPNLQVTDNGDGTFTFGASATDLGDGTFDIAAAATDNGDGTFTIGTSVGDSGVTVTDNGDGTFTAGTTSADLGDGTFSTTATTVDNGDGTFGIIQ